jgi:hypothetical protein
MFDKWNNHVNKFEKIVNLYRSINIDKDTSNYIDILESEFILYHSFNSEYNFLKFLIRFLISLFYQTKFKLIFSEKNLTDFTLVNTADYIFNDNLAPISMRINNIGKKTSTIKLYKTKKINIPLYFCYKNKFPLVKILSHFEIYSSKSNFILTLYTYFITIPRVQHLEKLIESSSNKISDIIISSDSSDILPRALAVFSKKNNKSFILIQNGPIQEDSIEWKTSISDEIIIWQENEDYFKKFKKNYKIYFPPRFYYTLENKESLIKKYEVVIFLPWVLNNKNGNLLLNFINNFFKYLINNTDFKIHIRYHPAGKIKLLNFNFEEISTNISTKEVLLSTKYVINFGSTISYDCNYLNIPCAVVNIENQLPDDSPIFNLNAVYNIKTFYDLNKFINDPYFFRNIKIDTSYSLIPYLISKLKNNNE